MASPESIEQRQAASEEVIHVNEADSLALRELTRRLADVQADAQLYANRAKAQIGDIVIARARLFRRLADTYGFDDGLMYKHDAMAHTLTRTKVTN